MSRVNPFRSSSRTLNGLTLLSSFLLCILSTASWSLAACDGYDWQIPVQFNNSLGESSFPTDLSLNFSFYYEEGYMESSVCNDFEVQNESGDRMEHYKGLCITDPADGRNTTVPVKVPSFNQTGYVCIGNSTASDQSAITEVFGDIYVEYFPSAWTSVTEGSGTDIDFSSGYLHIYDMTSSANCYTNTTLWNPVSEDFSFELEIKMYNTSLEGGSRVISKDLGTSSYSIHMAWNSSTNGDSVMHDGAAYQNTGYEMEAEKWVTMRLDNYFSNDSASFYVDGTYYYSDTWREHNGEVDEVTGFFVHSGTNGKVVYDLDNIRIRNVSAVPPTITFTGNLSATGGGPSDNPPTTTLEYPGDASTDTDGSVAFNCSCTDDNNVTQIDLWHNGTGSWAQNDTYAASGTWDSNEWTVGFGTTNRTVLWNCLCTDNASQTDWADANYTVEINTETDVTPPVITIVNPRNDTVEASNVININFSTNEAAAVCLYNFDGGTNYSMLNSSSTNWFIENQTAVANGTTVQLEAWCNDTAGNMGYNGTVWFTWENQTEGGGGYSCGSWIDGTDSWEPENVSLSYNEVNETRLIRLNLTGQSGIEQIELLFYLYQAGAGGKILEPWICIDADEDGVCDSSRQWGTTITPTTGSTWSDALNYTSNFTGSLINDTWATYILVGGYCADCDSSNYIQGNAILNNTPEIAYYGTWSKTTLDFSGGLWTTNNYHPMYAVRICDLGPDETPPTLSITSPLNQSYETDPLDINLSTNEAAAACWWDLDGGDVTYMSNSSQTVWYSQTNGSLVLDHTYRINLSCNDTSGNIGYNDSIYFTVTSPTTPSLDIYTPSNSTITDRLALQLAFSSNSTLDTCVYAIDGGSNTTISCTANDTWILLTNNTQYYVTVWANDTTGDWVEDTVYYMADVLEYGYVSMSDGQPQSAFSSYQDGWFVNLSMHDDPTIAAGDYSSRRLVFYPGDLVNDGDAVGSDFDTYFNNLVSQAGIGSYTIASSGNHDSPSGSLTNYKSYINTTLNDTYEEGNILFIWFSTTALSQYYGNISDSEKEWLNETLCENTDKITVVFTHHSIYNTTVSSEGNPHANRLILDESGNQTWFQDLQSQGCMPTFWIHGHVAFNGNYTDPDGHAQVEQNHGGTWFINDLSLIDTYSDWSEYRWLSFVNGSDVVTMRTREPAAGVWAEDLTYSFTISPAFSSDYSEPDTSPPGITIVSPLNQTYNESTVDLNVTTNETVDWCVQFNELEDIVSNVSLSGTGTNWYYSIDPAVNGTTYLHVYCEDPSGNLGFNDTIWFSYEFPNNPPSEPSGQLDPPSVIVGDNLTVNVSSTDADGDPLDYWYLFGYQNGTNITGWLDTDNLTILEGYEGEYLRAWAMADDGMDNGSAASFDMNVTYMNITLPEDDGEYFGETLYFAFDFRTEYYQDCDEDINGTFYSLGYINSDQNNSRTVGYGENRSYTVVCYSWDDSSIMYNKTVNFTNYYANWTIALYTENDWETIFNTSEGNASVFITCSGGSQYVYNFSGASIENIQPACEVDSITAKMDYPEDSYTRSRSAPSELEGEIRLYMIDATTYTVLQTPIYMNDYNYWDARVEVYKQSGSDHYTIAQGYFDVERKYVTYLTKDNTYYIRIDQGVLLGSSVRDIGYLYAASATAQYLSLSEISVWPTISLISDNLQMGASFDNISANTSTLRVSYYDAMNMTDSVEVEIFDGANTTPWYDNIFYGYDNLTISINGINTTRHTVHFTVDHDVLGNSPVEFSTGVGGGSPMDFELPESLVWLYGAAAFIIIFLTTLIIVPEIRLPGIFIVLAEFGIFFYLGFFRNIEYASVAILIAILVGGVIYEIRFKGIT